MTTQDKFIVTVQSKNKQIEIVAAKGDNLRMLLLKNGVSPYTALTRNLNCGGKGLCATCGVWLVDQVPAKHWHDKAAQQFGFPRLSCQITVEHDMTIQLVNKLVWGLPKIVNK